MRVAALLGALLLLGGCRGSGGVGDTVPPPPRELVEKSFKPPAGVAPRPGAPR